MGDQRRHPTDLAYINADGVDRNSRVPHRVNYGVGKHCMGLNREKQDSDAGRNNEESIHGANYRLPQGAAPCLAVDHNNCSNAYQ